MDAKKRLQEGWIHILVTFEILGKPKEHVDKTLLEFLNTVEKEERIDFLEKHVEPAMKNEQDDYFSAFAEVDMVVKNVDAMVWLAMNFTPASIEVIEPANFKFSALDLQNWMNDLLSKLHMIGIDYKQQASKLEYFRENLSLLIENTIVLSLARQPKKLPELSKDTAILGEALKQHVEKLLKEKKIAEKSGVYYLP